MRAVWTHLKQWVDIRLDSRPQDHEETMPPFYDATHTSLDWSAHHSNQWSQAGSASATPTSYFTSTSSYSSRRFNHTPPPPSPSLRLPEKPSVRYDRGLISPEASPIPPAIDESSYSSKRPNHTTPPPSFCLAKKPFALQDRRLNSPEASPTPPAIHESPLTVGYSSNSSERTFPGDDREPDLGRYIGCSIGHKDIDIIDITSEV